MAQSALGTKRHCQSCSYNYYDLNKSPIICPHCQTVFDPEVLLKSRKSKPVAVEVKKAPEPEADDIIDNELDGDEAETSTDNDILDDGEDLGVIASPDDADELTSDDAIEDELDAPVQDDE